MVKGKLGEAEGIPQKLADARTLIEKDGPARYSIVKQAVEDMFDKAYDPKGGPARKMKDVFRGMLNGHDWHDEIKAMKTKNFKGLQSVASKSVLSLHPKAFRTAVESFHSKVTAMRACDTRYNLSEAIKKEIGEYEKWF